MAELSLELRQVLVRHLTDRNMSAAEVATELGVSAQTVRRDLHTVESASRVDIDTTVAGDVLLLRLDQPMREALAVLRSTRQAPDTEAHNRAAARAAIRATADAVTDARTSP
ncbi:HTH domain-containing protein [Streptomyces shenzhenensis]|uniref:HTH domain-containing protein n=1 Tax=Streptomyces shenzhenensis TaxID=943815 RepID=UPI0033E512BA